MTEMTEDEINARANEKARKRKEARDRMLATKTIEKGLLIVHTGKGKGKSTAAFGLVMRALGHGMRESGLFNSSKASGKPGKDTFWKNSPIRSRSEQWAKGLPGRPKTALVTSRPHSLPGKRQKK